MGRDMIRNWLLAALVLPVLIGAWALTRLAPIAFISDARGQIACTDSGAKGCDYGGSIRHADFFSGYANQTGTAAYPPTPAWGIVWPAMHGNQPATYPTRPAWSVAGVDYAVGTPARLMPTLGDLTARATLKDPASVDRDPLLNPQGRGENCRFYISNAAAGGVMPGTTRMPIPAPFGGPVIVCANHAGSANQLVFERYNFGWNSRTGFGCVPVQIAGEPWGQRAADTSMDSAHIIIRDSLLVNGPNCNIWGGLGQGPGTTVAGPQAPALVFMVQLAAGHARNSFAFYRNTIFGCGGDAHASDLERALCKANFPSTGYDAIGAGGVAIKGFVQGATPGVAPMNAHAIGDLQGRNSWIEYNAFVHLPGRAVDYGYNTVGATTHVWAYNYFEGMIYQTQPYVTVSAIERGADGRETLTTTAPHGIAIGSYTSLTLNGGKATGFSAGWNGTWTMQAIDPTHLALTSATDHGNWTWQAGAYATVASNYAHGELQSFNGTSAGASFNGTITGTTLTINALQGTLAPGQYISATTGSGIAIPAGTRIVSGEGSTWTLNRDLGRLGPARMVSPYYTIGAQGAPTTIVYRYNTFVEPASAKGYGEATVYLSGGQNQGIPFGDYTGSIDHNVFVINLSTGDLHMAQAVASVSIGWQAFHDLAITDNYIDPTGAGTCFQTLSVETSDGLTMARNVNLLKPDDPWINTLDSYSIIPLVPGTVTNTQAESGIAYDPATAIVTLTLSFPATFHAGQKFYIGNNAVSAGPNYLAGTHTAATVSGNLVTFVVAKGLTGKSLARNPSIRLVDDKGHPEACYGSQLAAFSGG